MPNHERTIIDPEWVRDVSTRVYKMRLEDSSGGGPGAVARMIEKDKDEGQKLRGRAGSYDALTKAYVKALGVEAPRVVVVKGAGRG